jgi:hypothetical protein
MTLLFAFLFLLQVKHWLVDFAWQTTEHVKHKGTYGHPVGMMHSVEHAVGTGFCLLTLMLLPNVSIPLLTLVIMSTLDGILHYHIDWAKMNFGCRDIQTPTFWNHLGFDQMLHQLTYLGFAYALL